MSGPWRADQRPTLFLSDLHLRAPDEPRTQRVLAFLRRWRGEAEAIYLVGDVFDLWIGYRDVLFSAYFPVLRALAEVVEAGTRVVLFAGNHDPDLGAFFTRQLGVEVAQEPLWLTLGPHRVCVEHGDVEDPRAPWRRVVNRAARSPAARIVARGVPAQWAWSLARLYGDALRGAKGYRGLPPGLAGELLPRRAAEGADVLVIGHYHRAVHHEATIGGQSRRLFVLGDWVTHHTYLRFDGDFTLLRDRGPDAAPERLPPGDHPPPT